ncbi:TIGR04282 family arsenosugar biosynthesis glycosyltransferase [Microbulbifer magnicolonia]|uniref:TIGR04282 family arsenosugar biosynthesis glycosyltransferase n=1 Tax=Microbulbifer magnicolonia TaxID=3109744 RepID=UPI002B40BDCF|nr:TIGR04282 family arsenosugar biosynthesis glycosyltransferase [Microbulbifer sp. GG15]
MSNSTHRPLRLIVFAKAPLAGFAKTRLIPALGEEGAAALAAKMLRHTLQQCVQAQLGSVELCVAPEVEHDYWQSFPLPRGVYLSSQGGGDLGQRLWRAAARADGAGESVLLLGTDCPQLTAARLRAAASALRDNDAVVYPTRDGGYALLGLDRAEAVLFENIRWSTEVVAQQTRERLDQCGMRFEWLEMLVDIDEPQDLDFLPRRWGESL